ncbi:putative R3H domain containing protein [Trypanosoma cruzi]|uniref:Putative R3H domain containing protein n=1 Tax=Trypanosoma cruzi TaxID=5693 RepID=A0A2V2VR93_TRYCR|nr:putative R3H domain containing protein [Trypanosoma cruzi]
MSAAGSREEMLEALQKAKQAMARRVPVVTLQETPSEGGELQLQDAETQPSFSRPRPHVPSEAKTNRSHFFDTWCRKIEMFVADPTKTVLELPNDLAANDRRELHSLAEKYNLSHQSRGSGATRQLVLKKDALHYRMPDARPDNIETIKQNAGSKQSKFHLRRFLQDPDAAVGSIGAFADEATANMVRRLDRATDEYRRAVELGYSQEELLAIEAGESVEEILRRGGDGRLLLPSAVEQASGDVGSVPSVATHGGNEALHGVPPDNRKGKIYEEVCLRCGTRAHVDYDVQKWECNGYCAQCATQTIWKLVELDGVKEELVHPSFKRDRKRNFQEMEMEAAPAMREPEEIDKDNDEDDTITVEDVVDMASMNDFCAADVNWIRSFATHHQPRGSGNILSAHIVFCIEFEDLFSMRIFRDFLSLEDKKHAMKERKRTREESNAADQKDKGHCGWFLRLCEVKETGVPLSTLLEEISLCIPERYDCLAVAFPNMSVYGAVASCVCLIQSNKVEESSLEILQRKYGKRSIQFARDLCAVLLNGGETASVS